MTPSSPPLTPPPHSPFTPLEKVNHLHTTSKAQRTPRTPTSPRMTSSHHTPLTPPPFNDTTTNTAIITNSTTWTPRSDAVLASARAKRLNWHTIASTHFPSKTANACRKRHERLMERRRCGVEGTGNGGWDAKKLELVAVRYMAHRKELWKSVAEGIGERWQVVELKCLETGLKGLGAAARAAQRRETRGEEHDSGLGADDTDSIGEHEDVTSALPDHDMHDDADDEAEIDSENVNTGGQSTVHDLRGMYGLDLLANLVERREYSNVDAIMTPKTRLARSKMQEWCEERDESKDENKMTKSGSGRRNPRYSASIASLLMSPS